MKYALLLVVLLLVASPARADVSAPTPLLVLLHGDHGVTPPELEAAWARFAASRGVALLSLSCPVEEGCRTHSWWQWNGDPAWIARQVDRFAGQHPIDRSRLWIAGWSGGASYIGMRSPELARTFSGFVLHGGGVAPATADCGRQVPVTMLLGDKNPLHPLALGLRDYYARCGHPLGVTILPGADHAGEWKALERHGGSILDGLRASTKMACLSRHYVLPARPVGSVDDVFAIPYHAGSIRPIVDPNEDPGRVRIDALFDTTYGSSAREVERALVSVMLNGQQVRVHRRIEAPFRRVAARLTEATRADPRLARLLTNFGGTFNWRNIAGTNERSAHAWGIAIDLDPARAEYWRNDSLDLPKWHNRIPQAIVDAFEAEGFIWGGRWFHYDTMHFEYRPELIDPLCGVRP